MRNYLYILFIVFLTISLSIMGYAESGAPSESPQQTSSVQYKTNPQVLKIKAPKTILSLGETMTLTYRGPQGEPVRWETKDSDIIALSEDGEIQGIGRGNASVRLFAGEYVDMYAVSVVDAQTAVKMNAPVLNYLWKKIGVNEYCFNADTDEPLTGFQYLNRRWYFFDKRGVLQKRWIQINKQLYYFGDTGMYTGTRYINKKKYVFDEDGKYLSGGTPKTTNIHTVPADTLPRANIENES